MKSESLINHSPRRFLVYKGSGKHKAKKEPGGAIIVEWFGDQVPAYPRGADEQALVPMVSVPGNGRTESAQHHINQQNRESRAADEADIGGHLQIGVVDRRIEKATDRFHAVAE